MPLIITCTRCKRSYALTESERVAYWGASKKERQNILCPDCEKEKEPIISPVFMICNAYESGVGHGIQGDDLPNPYVPDSEESEAYDIGYAAGVEMAKETGFKPSRKRQEVYIGAASSVGTIMHENIQELIETLNEKAVIVDDMPEHDMPIRPIGDLLLQFDGRHPTTSAKKTDHAARCRYNTKVK